MCLCHYVYSPALTVSVVTGCIDVRLCEDQMGWPHEVSVRLPFWEIRLFGPHDFEPWSSQTNDLKIDTCHFLARYSALLG